MFRAPWWSLPINPHFLPRRALHRAMAETGSEFSGRVLDAGCGLQPYRHLLPNSVEIVGLESGAVGNSTNKRADVLYDGLRFPFADSSFQGVLCNQVLEHVFTPEEFLREIHRVLAPGGRLVLTVPFIWPEHEQPWDSQRYTSFGLCELLRRCDLEPNCQRKLVCGFAAIAAITADRVNSGLRPLPRPMRLIVRALLVTPLSLVGWMLVVLFDNRDHALYLDNLIVARRPATG